MRIEEVISRKFIAHDGTEFDNEDICKDYECSIAHNKVGKSAAPYDII